MEFCHRERGARGDPGATNKILSLAPGLLRHFVPRNDWIPQQILHIN
jgi:hypothetical protein